MKLNKHKGLANKARKIYNGRLKQSLEPSCSGDFVAIEVEPGDHFLGTTPLKAINNGKQKYPKKVFHVIKVGYKAAIMLKKRIPNLCSSFIHV